MCETQCSPSLPGLEMVQCPVTGSRGAPVDLETVKALLTEPALRRLNGTPHRFCTDPSCDVVYFDARGALYRTADIRVPVWHKEQYGNRMICYCFGESEGIIRAEVQETGRSLAPDRVRAHIAAGRCACNIRNPRGACCLADLESAVRRVAQELDATAAEQM